MALTAKEIYDLNNCMECARVVSMGDILNNVDNIPDLEDLTASVTELNIMDGVTRTTAQINLLAQGVAAGMKIAHGIASINADTFSVVTGLATVTSVVCSMVGDPSMTHMYSTAGLSGTAGTIIIKSWKPTAAGNVAPVAATSTFSNVAWIAIGA